MRACIVKDTGESLSDRTEIASVEIRPDYASEASALCITLTVWSYQHTISTLYTLHSSVVELAVHFHR